MAIKETIGKLDRSVEIVKFTVTQDEYNASSRTQELVKRVWAKLNFKSSTEDFEEKVFSITNRDYLIHWDNDITDLNLQDLAVVEDGKTYYVTGANPDVGGRKMFVLLNCEYRG